MELNPNHTKQIGLFYVVVFLLTSLWHFVNGISLTQLSPVFFVGSLDITGHFIMATRIAKLTMLHGWCRIILDGIYVAFPVVLVISFCYNFRYLKFVAIGCAAYALLYAFLLQSFTYVSMHSQIAYMFFPLLFVSRNTKNFYFLFHALRILFTLFFLSAGLWKIRAGGIFSIEQMSGILFLQHSATLSSSGQSGYIDFIAYLINHPTLSWSIYCAGMLLEIIFVVGLFTKRFDKYLAVLLMVFVIADYFFMEINYFAWIPFVTCFWYSRFKMPSG